MSTVDVAQHATPDAAVSRSLFALRWALLCVGGIACALLVPFGAEAMCAVLAAVILVARPQMALGALALAAWIKVPNPYLVDDRSALVAAGWLPVLAGIARAALQPAATVHARGVLWIMAFAAVAGASVLTTPALLAVSIPKLLVFSAGLVAMLALVSTASQPHQASRGVSHDVITVLFLVTTCLSAPLLAIPAIGFMLNQTGFQGVTGQPQAFAVLFAPLVAYYVMRTIETGSLAVVRWCAAIAGVALLVYSRSRTGVGAALIGLCLGLFVWWRSKGARGFGLVFWLYACGVLAGIGYVFQQQILESLSEFLLKGVAGELNAESLLTSRAPLYIAVWQSFVAHPLLGIGFGVPTTLGGLLLTTSDSLGGVVLSATTEKGNGFLQVLEETGLLGTVILAGLITMLARTSGLARSASATALVFAALATNFGEGIIFSLGGVGLAQWACVMLGLTMPPPSPRPSNAG